MTEEERELYAERRDLAEERIRQIPEEDKNAWLSGWFEGWAVFFLTGQVPDIVFPETGRAEELLEKTGRELAALSPVPRADDDIRTVLYEELFLQLYGCAQLPGATRSVRAKEMADAVYWFTRDNAQVLPGGNKEDI